jgi:hypothetical protein
MAGSWSLEYGVELITSSLQPNDGVLLAGALLKDRFDRGELLFVVWVDAGKTYILSLLVAVHPSAENQL